MSTHRVLTRWTGFCASCPEERPLLLVSTGPHGLRGWLSGAGAEDRTLSYACGVCGRVEHVPATEAEDEAYDASFERWPDWVAEEPVSVEVPVTVELPAADELFAAALLEAAVLVPEARRGEVRVVRLPAQRVSATDTLALAA